jgi:hypothetical protein
VASRKADTTNLIGNCKNGNISTPHRYLFLRCEAARATVFRLWREFDRAGAFAGAACDAIKRFYLMGCIDLRYFVKKITNMSANQLTPHFTRIKFVKYQIGFDEI